MKSTPIRVMEETTAIQPLSKKRDMRNIIQAERYRCSPSHPMRKRIDAMTKHRIKMESFIHKNNNLKKTYNNTSIKTVQCTYSSLPMSSEHTNRSLTIGTATHTVTRDQKRYIQKRSHTLMTSTRKLHGYMYTLMAPQQTQYKIVVLEV